MYLVYFLAVLIAVSASSGGAEDFYSLNAVDIHGNDVSLETYRGKVSLVVNVASECGFTDTNYKELVNLQDLYSYRGFTVLAFPSNQFGEQEPARNEQIMTSATDRYGVNFPMLAKIDVYGENQCSVYKFLARTTGSTPQWNFCKYLIDQRGQVVQYFTQNDQFSVIKKSLGYLLNKNVEF